MKFEVEIGDDIFQKLIKGIVLGEFNAEGYRKGAGYEMLTGFVKEHVAQMAETFGPLIRESIQRMTPGIIEEICGNILRAQISKVAKEMKKKGDLPLFEPEKDA